MQLLLLSAPSAQSAIHTLSAMKSSHILSQALVGAAAHTPAVRCAGLGRTVPFIRHTDLADLRLPLLGPMRAS